MVESAPVLVESVPVAVESAILDVVSVEVDTEVESAEVEVLFELQALTAKVIAKAKKPNLNEFFILFFILILKFNCSLIPQTAKGNPG